MCCVKTSGNRTNHLQERALGRVYDEDVSTFEKLVEKDNSVEKNSCKKSKNVSYRVA